MKNTMHYGGSQRTPASASTSPRFTQRISMADALRDAVGELVRSGALDAPETRVVAVKQLHSTFPIKLTYRQCDALIPQHNA